MGKIEERFSELEGFLEELTIEVEKSQVASDTTGKYISIISDIKLESPENYKIYIRHLKELLSTETQYFHDKVEIIRKVSPGTANYFDTQILEYEKNFRRFIHFVEETQDKGDKFLKEKMDELIKTMTDLLKSAKELTKQLDLNYNLLQDMLKFIRG